MTRGEKAIFATICTALLIAFGVILASVTSPMVAASGTAIMAAAALGGYERE
jgi:hypothetical protein